MNGRVRATLIGGTAVLLWGGLALFTSLTGRIPPFQLVAMSFAVATLLGAAKWLVCREDPRRFLRHPPALWALGIGGLFGYHFFYFMALRNAPAVDASLIAYLWPLLIMLMSALLPGGRLRWWHLAGALLGLAGCTLLVTGGGEVAFRAEFAPGYAAALACALTWSAYSVLSRRFQAVPTDTVTWFCAGTAFLGLLAHLAFESAAWPSGPGEWLAVLALGLGPVGIAFFAWDHGVKHGDIRALGGFSYAAPLISTLLLIAFGQAEASWTVAAACAAIMGGALLAARDMLSASGESRES